LASQTALQRVSSAASAPIALQSASAASNALVAGAGSVLEAPAPGDCRSFNVLASARSATERASRAICTAARCRTIRRASLRAPAPRAWSCRTRREIARCGASIAFLRSCPAASCVRDAALLWREHPGSIRQHCIDRFGFAGLRTTRTQFYLRRIAGPESFGLPVGPMRLGRRRRARVTLSNFRVFPSVHDPQHSREVVIRRYSDKSAVHCGDYDLRLAG
jgi:hypothetical protein